jgi:hypothetical protein
VQRLYYNLHSGDHGDCCLDDPLLFQLSVSSDTSGESEARGASRARGASVPREDGCYISRRVD